MPITIDNVVLYTLDEVAEKLAITTRTVRAYMKKKGLKSQRIGSRLYISKENLKDFVTGDNDVEPKK